MYGIFSYSLKTKSEKGLFFDDEPHSHKVNEEVQVHLS